MGEERREESEVNENGDAAGCLVRGVGVLVCVMAFVLGGGFLLYGLIRFVKWAWAP